MICRLSVTTSCWQEEQDKEVKVCNYGTVPFSSKTESSTSGNPRIKNYNYEIVRQQSSRLCIWYVVNCQISATNKQMQSPPMKSNFPIASRLQLQHPKVTKSISIPRRSLITPTQISSSEHMHIIHCLS